MMRFVYLKPLCDVAVVAHVFEMLLPFHVFIYFGPASAVHGWKTNVFLQLGSTHVRAVLEQLEQLFAWLVEKKLDNLKIGKYLNSREITFQELELLEDAELDQLIQDIEKDRNTCRSLLRKLP